MYQFYTSGEFQIAASFVVAALNLSAVIGGPMAGGLLAMDGFLGFAGWQLIFIVEGLFTIVLSIFVYIYLPNNPQSASFLSAQEKDWLIGRQRKKQDRMMKQQQNRTFWTGILNIRTWYACVVLHLIYSVMFGFMFWNPIVIDAAFQGKLSNTVVSLISTIPYILAVIGVILLSYHSKLTKERRLHVCVPYLIGGIVLACLQFFTINIGGVVGFLDLSLAVGIINMPFPLFVTWLSIFLSNDEYAAGSALANSIGGLGGMTGNILIGYLSQDKSNDVDEFQRYAIAQYVLAGIAFMLAILTYFFPVPDQDIEENYLVDYDNLLDQNENEDEQIKTQR
eukprot:TRINITY_DN32999_c1_g1_i1.p1 TRINITY_DN32999_c1_g1~~TRINITY_DN32999_c1_g1_i1.p1  ORF type:complete len:386 (+),score=49.23 TRINITY_DN32999_c1_g1_i1:149-1159(+)